MTKSGPHVGVIMGSTSDWTTMCACTSTLEELGKLMIKFKLLTP